MARLQGVAGAAVWIHSSTDQELERADVVGVY